MLIQVVATLAVAASCPNGDLQVAAETILRSIRTQNFECARQMIQNPELNFPGGRIDDAVLESFAFRAKGKRSYYDIAGSANIFIDIANGKDSSSVFYVDGKYKDEYLKNRSEFKKKYFMRRYFVCNFVNDGSWKLTEDFCFTEGEY